MGFAPANAALAPEHFAKSWTEQHVVLAARFIIARGGPLYGTMASTPTWKLNLVASTMPKLHMTGALAESGLIMPGY